MAKKTQGKQPYKPKRPCKAHNVRGEPCGRPAIPGGTVCRTHGGKAPQVMNKAKQRIREYVAATVDPDRVLQEAGRLAMADITQLYDDQGKLKEMKDWPDTVKGSVKSAETVRGNLDDTDGKTDKVVRVIMKESKVKALEMLFKNLGLFEEKVRVDANVTYKWAGE